MTTLLDEEWRVLADLLPARWREMARETGAIRRARGAVDSPETLLKVLLLHVAGGLSLKQAVARARVQGLAAMSDVALLKRLRSSEAWLRELARRMFESSRFARAVSRAPMGRRLRAADATTVEEPGATGTDWRVHYCVDLTDLRCDFFEVTDVRGAETYERVPVAPGDIVLADRGYCRRESVAHVLGKGGDVVVRLHSTNFPLLESRRDKPFKLLPRLRKLPAGAAGDWPVRFRAADRLWDARVCAARKSAAAAEAAKKKLLAAASRRQTGPVRPETLESAEYVFVLVTLEREEVDAAAALDLYRARWQVELCFKRLKSLLRLGHLPKTSDVSARAWIQGKLLAALLVEALVDRARLFSPWGYDLAAAQPVA
jgi:IS4 transposase